MKKAILLSLLILVASNLIAQSDDVQIKSVRKVTTDGSNGNSQKTATYTFENGKLIAASEDRKKTFFDYNDKGLLSENYYINPNSTKIRNLYEYDSKGYISKIKLLENDKPTGEMEFKYELKSNNNFTITNDFKSFTTRPGYKFLNQRMYEMKENVLTLKVETIMGKSKNSSTNIFNFKNDNLIYSNLGNKKKSKYEMSYNYDNNSGVNAMLKKSVLGDKYFINSFLVDNLKIFRNIGFTSKNNLLSEKIEKKSKTISVTVYKSEIEYNSDNYPVKITRVSENGKHKIEIFIDYE